MPLGGNCQDFDHNEHLLSTVSLRVMSRRKMPEMRFPESLGGVGLKLACKFNFRLPLDNVSGNI